MSARRHSHTHPQHHQTSKEPSVPSTIYHSHHIVPKHAGGTNDSSNRIKLTIPGHAFAHWCLWMKFGRLQDKCAWLMLSNITEEGEMVRRELMSSPEIRSKISKANIGNKKALGHKYEPSTKTRER